jgi:hypothetical protein
VPRKSPAVKVLTIAVLASRVAYGAALLLSPEKVAGNRWLGPGAGRPAAQVPLRGLGAREVALHGAALAGFLRGSPIRPFLAASIAGDLGDIAATALAREGLPDGSAPATAAVAGGSLLLTALVAALSGE